ncbi:MAG: VWA domain-containing protein [Elusimicrobia bacterium]|nr:VWA domain-containing protein [Elusimicrobiota bacterium]
MANIPPGEEIEVKIRYSQDIHYEDGVYRFVFPMVVGPRYIPPRLSPLPQEGGEGRVRGYVSDALRLSPPALKPGERSGQDISLAVKIDAGVAIKNISCLSHVVDIEQKEPGAAFVKLDSADSIPNKDFVLTYETSGEKVETALLAHKKGREGYFSLIIQPKTGLAPAEMTARELVFVLDTSGSMSGFPIETAKEAIRRFLEGLNPNDTFQIIEFAGNARLLFPKPLVNTRQNIELAREALMNLRGGGGTEMLEGIRLALNTPKDPHRLRIVFFMTDGYIGNEREILAFIEQNLGDSRIFPLGAGSSVNRFLLEEMALLGRGFVQYVRYNEDHVRLQKTIDGFYEKLAKPYLTDLELDWGGLKPADIYPQRIPDLFAGQPLAIHGRYFKAGQGTIAFKGKLAGKPWSKTIAVELPQESAEHEVLGKLWARACI